MTSATTVLLVSSLPTAGTATAGGGAVRASSLAAAALLALAPVSGASQQVVEIGDRISCRACTIEAGLPVTLAPPLDHVYFTSLPPPHVMRDREGNYITARVSGDALFAVFEADGTYRSSYGRFGEGPGEFASIPWAIAVGEDDVIYAIDGLHLHTLAPRAERMLRDKVRLPEPLVARRAVVLKSGIAVQAPLRTTAGITTVQILEPDGTIQASVGIADLQANDLRSQSENLRPIEANIKLRRVLGKSNDDADVWIAPFDRYQVVRYGPDGEEKTRIERVSEWVQLLPLSSSTPGAPFSAPADRRLLGIRQDADGLLWISISRAPSSFSPVADERPPGVERRRDPFTDMNQFVHMTVEVLDPVNGELVARRDFDEWVAFVNTVDDDVLVYSLHPDALGNIDCVIRPLKLQRP